MATRKKADLPIGYFPEGANIPKPFVLNWAEPIEAAQKLRAATNPFADTCFTEMFNTGHLTTKEGETISSTPPIPPGTPGELADTSVTF